MDSTAVTSRRGGRAQERAVRDSAGWVTSYLRGAGAADGACALATGLLPPLARFGTLAHMPLHYAVLSGGMPLLWWASVALAGGYDPRVIGAGSGEFRRVLNAGLTLTAAVAIASYASRAGYARDYVMVALPGATLLDLGARYTLRKRLHHRRRHGACVQRAVAVGHPDAVAGLIAQLHRETSHGLSVVAACLAGELIPEQVAGVPVHGGLAGVSAAVAASSADTVAVITCPELTGSRLRMLAWELEKTGTQLCLAPALLDVAGPRTSLRAAGGLPLVQVDSPDLAGPRYALKGAFDRVAAALGLLVLAVPMLAVALAVRLSDPGPALFRQTRVGRDGRRFTLYKFRTMVVNAEELKASLMAANEVNGVLFKIRRDPRLTRIGGWLRRWSVDELPQLLNVVRGEMSLVGPRPWRPRPYEEASVQDEAVWRRLAVKPGITGLWQVSGRADLPWEESVRLDVRYVENWSLLLDLRILWRTGTAVIRQSGAY